MKTAHRASGGTGRYHHGDLRRALLASAFDLLSEGGVEALSLRAVARGAGVSHAAPQHHFPDKAALIEAMAVQAFGEFEEALQSGWDSAPGEPEQQLLATGLAYLRFSLRRPHLFALINRPELWRGRDWKAGEGAVEEASLAAYRVLEHGVEVCQDAGLIESGDPTPWASLAWSCAHGLAMLASDGMLPIDPDEDEPALAMAVFTSMVHGLAIRNFEDEP